MIPISYGFKNQRVVLCEVIRDIEKDIAELSFQKNVLKSAYNSLKSENDDLLENKSLLNEEAKIILLNKNLNRK